MCTRALYATNDRVLVGRNMDFHFDLVTNLWALPQGIGRDAGEGGLSWTSQYGSVVATCFDMMSSDGLNERGLAGHILWLTEADYGTPDPGRTALPLSMWLQYILDNFASVAEAVAWVEAVQPQIIPVVNPVDGSIPPLHLALDDASGDSAIIEYLDGSPRVWHSREYVVMTNSPTFDAQLELVEDLEGFGGDRPLPGTNDAVDRFARALYYVTHLPEPTSDIEAVAGVLSVMRNTAQPFRTPDPDQPFASQTLWQTVSDLTHLRYVFVSTTRPNIVWVDLDALDLSVGAPTLKLDLVADTALEGGLAGDVSGDFRDVGPLTILLPTPG